MATTAVTKTAKQTKNEWTEEDKMWAIGGGAVVLAGGIYLYLKNKKANETDTTGAETNYIDSSEGNNVTAIGTGNTSNVQNNSNSGNDSLVASTVTNKRQPDPIRWSVGQTVMANVKSGTPVYEAKKMANGSYTSSGELKKTFEMGDEIGKIIWVGALSDGTYRYVIEGKVLGLLNTLFWVADYRVILPIDGSKGIATTKAPVITKNNSLNSNLLLKYGSKGLEVQELQKRLGVKIDGDFGKNTLAALQKQKGVSQITLAAFATTNVLTLDFNKILKYGSIGLEVKELQKRLGFSGIDVDGDFKRKTESALFAMKKVKQTTLNQFSYV